MAEQFIEILRISIALVIAYITLRFFFGFMLSDCTYEKWAIRHIKHGFWWGTLHIALVAWGMRSAAYYALVHGVTEGFGGAEAGGFSSAEMFYFLDLLVRMFSIAVGIAFFWITICLMTEYDQ